MQVFSAFGFVHKITTFEKTAGFQVISPPFSVLVGLLHPLKISSFNTFLLCRHWCSFPMQKQPQLRKIPWMDEPFLGDSCINC